MKSRVGIYVVINPASDDVHDVSFHLGEAQRRALEHIKETADEVHWAVSNEGHMVAYSLDGERVLIEIVKYQAELWEETLRYAGTQQ